MSLHFYSADIDFSLDNPDLVTKWIQTVIRNHERMTGKITYLFCSDDYILDVNKRFLDHDTYTDIITFDNVEGNLVSGDILISIDRVGENARQFGVSFSQELHRVLVHGVLHLLGFKDKSEEDSKMMRAKENESLQILSSLE